MCCDSSKSQLDEQCGFVLLGLLLMLVAASALVITVDSELLARPQSHQGPRYLDAIRVFEILHESKIALMASALGYADNYKPSGAGLGHFPCPDRDSPDDGNPRNDGPNPPCARHEQTIGRLPRITSTGQINSLENPLKMLEFYALESMLDRQPWYVIAPEMINNPANREVNPGTTSSLTLDGVSGLIALVIEPGNEVQSSSSGDVNSQLSQQWVQHRSQSRPSTASRDYLEGVNALSGLHYHREYDPQSNDFILPLLASELMPLVKRRVAGTVVRLLRQAATRTCPDIEFADYSLSGLSLSGPSSERAVIPVGLKGSGPCFPHAGGSSLHCQQDLYIGRLPVLSGDCPVALTVENRLQGIDANRHWLLRNNWPDYVDYEVLEQCRTSSELACDVRVDYSNDAGRLSVQVASLSDRDSRD